MRNSLLVLLISLVLLNVPAFTQEKTKIKYIPHWLPQAQFAGYYMAKEKGIYDKYGLDVTILTGGPNYPCVPILEEKTTEIASMFLSGAIKGMAAGVDLVDIGQLSQRSALIFIAKSESGIRTPQDFNGKKIGIWRSDFQELPMAFLKKYNIEAEIVPITSTVNLFLRGGIDVMCVMWYNEFHQVLNFGINPDELEIFHFIDHDLDFPEDGIYCLRSYYDENREACDSFVKASIEGWQYAFEHEEETLDMVLKYMQDAKVPANRVHQKWMLKRMKDIFMPFGKEMTGHLYEDDYYLTAYVLLESQSIDSIPDYNKFNQTPEMK